MNRKNRKAVRIQSGGMLSYLWAADSSVKKFMILQMCLCAYICIYTYMLNAYAFANECVYTHLPTYMHIQIHIHIHMQM